MSNNEKNSWVAASNKTLLYFAQINDLFPKNILKSAFKQQKCKRQWAFVRRWFVAKPKSISTELP